jgi:predicted nucleic acid-binding protein
MDRVDAWLAAPTAVLLEPSSVHHRRLRQLLADTGMVGNLVNDAHLAALALEHRFPIVTYDRDFARFDGVVVDEL